MTDGLAQGAPAIEPLPPLVIADLLDAAARIVVAEILALGPYGGWRPAPGEWSANECVGHLIEAERRGFAGRIEDILAAYRPRRGSGGGGGAKPPATPATIAPTLEDWDPPAVAAERRDHGRDGAELAAEFEALRADGIALVRSLTTADLDRSGIHPAVGELRVDDLLGEWVHHDRNHVRQLLAVTQARVWGQMGNARRFSLEEA